MRRQHATRGCPPADAVALVNHKGVSFNILIINFIWLWKFDNKFVQMEFYKAFIIKFQQLNKVMWRMPFDWFRKWGGGVSATDCKWEVVQEMIYCITMTMSELKLEEVWAVIITLIKFLSVSIQPHSLSLIMTMETENQIPLWLPYSSSPSLVKGRFERHQISSKLSPFPFQFTDPWSICVKPR